MGQGWGEPRSKTVEFYDPRAAAAAGLALPGVEHLQAMVDGVLPPPPIASLMGTSVEIKVSFLRAVHAGDALTAVGTVVKPGRRVAFSQGEVRDAGGRAVATATSTCLVFDLPS